MQPTPKWNTELKLEKPAYPLKLKRMYEITGNHVHEDELVESMTNVVNDGLQVDPGGEIHRVGEEIPEFPSGEVMTRARAEHLIKSGQRRLPPNLVNRFPSDHIRRRSRPFGKRLTLQAIAVVNPAAYHALAIHPSAHINGVIVGDTGDIFIEETDEMGWGFFKKIGRFAKRKARGLGRGIKKAGRGVKRGARWTARRGGRALRWTGRGLKKVGKGVYRGARWVVKAHIKLAKMGFKAMKALAKLAARLAAIPIILAVRPAIRARTKQLARGRRPSKRIRRKASKDVIRKLRKSRNPLIKFAGLVLSYVGTRIFARVSGNPDSVMADTAIMADGNGGHHCIGAEGTTVIGLTGAEIAVMAKAAAVALKPYIIKLVSGFAIKKGMQLVQKARQRRRQPPPPPPREPPGQMPGTPDYESYGSAQDAGNYQDYGTTADYGPPPRSPRPRVPPYRHAPPNFPQDPGYGQYTARDYQTRYQEVPVATQYSTEYSTEYDTEYDVSGGLSLEESLEQSLEEPLEQSLEQPIGLSLEESLEEPLEQSLEESLEQPMGYMMGQPAGKHILPPLISFG